MKLTEEEKQTAIELISNQFEFPFELEQMINSYHNSNIDNEIYELRFEEVKKFLIIEDIIFEQSKNKYNITPKFREITSKGGWKKYEKNIKNQRNWFLKDNWANIKWLGTTLIALLSFIISITK